MEQSWCFKNRTKFKTAAEIVINDKTLTKIIASPSRVAGGTDLLNELGVITVTQRKFNNQVACQMTVSVGGVGPDDGKYKGYIFFPKGMMISY